MFNLFLIYVIISFICIIFTKRNNLPTGVKNLALVVLSGSTLAITNHRLKTAKRILKQFPQAEVIVCGSKFSEHMNNYLKPNTTKQIIKIQSNNTSEDASFLKKNYKDSEKLLIIITNSSHQRRAYHTFQRFFRDENLINYPTNDIFTWYSPLLPTGWIATAINTYKDYKYNNRI